MPGSTAGLNNADTHTHAALFGFGPMQDYRDSTQVVANLDQGGMALPSRDFYLEGKAKVVIATDDARIAEHARGIGVECVMTDADLPSGTDRARAAMEIVAPDADFVVNLQGDAPFTPPAHVSALIEHAKQGDVVTPVIRLSWDALDHLRERTDVQKHAVAGCRRTDELRVRQRAHGLRTDRHAQLNRTGPAPPDLRHNTVSPSDHRATLAGRTDVRSFSAKWRVLAGPRP